MISLLKGTIAEISGKEITLLTSGGVGYKILGSPALLSICQPGKESTVTTHLVVREDALELFGFVDQSESALFKHFLSVSGVGPKTALQLLALGSANDIAGAVHRGDVSYLTTVSGIGKKTAERLIVELRSKLKDMGTAPAGSQGGTKQDMIGDVIDALVGLGYSAIEARETINRLDSQGKNSEQLLREALQTIK